MGVLCTLSTGVQNYRKIKRVFMKHQLGEFYMYLATRTSIFFQLIKFYPRQNKQENQSFMIRVRTRESARGSVKETTLTHVR